MLNDENMCCVRMMKVLYFPSSRQRKGGMCHGFWSSLHEAREYLKVGLIRNLGNGRNINIMNNPWVPTIPGFKFSARQRDHELAYERMSNNGREWDFDTVSTYTSPLEVMAIL